MKLSPKEAAERIRDRVTNAAHPHPEDRHLATFIGRVCEELGLDKDPATFATVAQTLHEEKIEPSAMQEYPKMLTRPATDADIASWQGPGRAPKKGTLIPVLDEEGNHVILQSEEDEEEYSADTKAEAAPAKKGKPKEEE